MHKSGISALTKEKRTNVINTSCVIGMLVRKQNGIEFGDGVLQHLLSEIRPTINHNCTLVPLHQNRRTQPLITWVITLANRMVAADNRYAL